MKSLNTLGVVLLVTTISILTACQQPVLESANCLEARDTVKRVYSIHIDGGPRPTGKTLERLKDFISRSLYKTLSEQPEGKFDYLTQTTDFPKATRVGVCRDTQSGPEFDVLLIWRRNESNLEEIIRVGVVKEGKWVVNSVQSAK